MTQIVDVRKAKPERATLGIGLVGTYVALATMLVGFGALKLVLLPFDGDQSIFLLAGETIASGGRIYVDYWDVKQPGIYLFFAAGGSLFGFTSWGVHLFEIVYWAAMSLLIWRLLRPMLENRWLASSVPLVFLATYFGHAGRWHATQVEVLAAGPLAIAIILVCRALLVDERRNGRLYFWAGVCAGVTLIFKLPLAPTYLALFGAVWVHLWIVGGRRDVAPYLSSCLWVLCGVAAALAPLLAWLYSQDLIGELWYVTVQYPREVIADGIPAADGYLRAAAGLWFLASATAGLAFIIGLYIWFERRAKPLLFTLSLVCFGGIAASIAIQIYSLWEYHFQLFYMPLAMLFVVAIDRFLIHARGRTNGEGRFIETGAVALLVSVIASQVMASDWRPAYQFVRDVVVRGETFDSFLADSSKAMGQLAKIARSVDVEPGARIYVLGDPKLYIMMDARQAVPVPGWYWELAPQSLFDRTAEDLWRVQPGHIFMVDYYEDLVFGTAPSIRILLEERYEVVARTPWGRWYGLRSASAP